MRDKGGGGGEGGCVGAVVGWGGTGGRRRGGEGRTAHHGPRRQHPTTRDNGRGDTRDGSALVGLMGGTKNRRRKRLEEFWRGGLGGRGERGEVEKSIAGPSGYKTWRSSECEVRMRGGGTVAVFAPSSGRPALGAPGGGGSHHPRLK